MIKIIHDYGNDNINGDDLEAQVFHDYPKIKKGYVLVCYQYEDSCVTIFIGTKAELEKQAMEIYQEGSMCEHDENVFYENGKRKEPKISY
jgi:hypothetical protein